MKKYGIPLLILLLILLMIQGLYIVESEPEKPEPGVFRYSDYEYIQLPDGTVEIVGYTGEAAEVTVPQTLDGHSVTRIGDEAFFACDFLTGVTLPEGLTGIGHRVFSNCSSLTGITLPDSVTEMGINPFVYCEKLTDIRISPNHPVFAVVDGVLFHKGERKLICYPIVLPATEYQVPEGTRSIGNDAFYGCPSLTAVTFPEGLTSIGNLAFRNCSSLTGITLPEGLTDIGAFAFSGCPSLTGIALPEKLTSIASDAFEECPENMLFTVVRNSYAAKWCEENGKNYIYSDSLE